MKPLVEYPDPEAAVIDYFNAAYTGAILARKPTTIATKAPQGALVGSAWTLQVELDGTPGDEVSRYIESPTIRVNCHAAPGRRSDVKAHASLAFGLLDIHPGDEQVWSTKPLVRRSQVITDPATKNLMVWFTFRVNLRAIPVSV